MNSVNFQDTKLAYINLLLFYTLIINYQKEKARKQSYLKYKQKNKIPRNKLHQKSENYALKTKKH